MIYTDWSMNMQSYKCAIELIQTKPELTDTQGRKFTHNLTAILMFWYEFDQKERESEWAGHWAQGEVVQSVQVSNVQLL